MKKSEQLIALELVIAKLLRWGVLFAGLLMFVGWVSNLQLTGNPLESFHHYQHAPFIESFTQSYLSHQWGLFISYIGLVVLVCLPVVRVMMTAILFFKQRDFLMASAATVVFVALAISFSMGFEI